MTGTEPPRRTILAGLIVIVSVACGGSDGGPSGPPSGGGGFATGPWPASLVASDGKVFWSESGENAIDVVVAGAGTPSVLAPEVGAPAALTVEGGELFWLEERTGFSPSGCGGVGVIRVLRKVSLAAFALPTNLAIGDACYRTAINVVTDGANVFWVSTLASPYTSLLEKTPVSGGSTTTLTSTAAPIVALARDAAYLYWMESTFPDTTGAIRRVPLAGGAIETVASGIISRAGNFALNSTAVFYTHTLFPNGEEILSAPIAGGTPTPLQTVAQAPNRLVADESELYWIDGTAIFSMPVTGGPPVPLVNVTDSPIDLVLRGSDLLWTETTGPAHRETGVIRTIPKAGGSASVIHQGGDAPRWLAGDPAYVYWSEGGPVGLTEGFGQIARTPMGGGPVDTLVSGVQAASPPIAVSTDYVYVADGWRIKRVPRAGGLMQTVAASDDRVMALATDGSYVYWVANNLSTVYKAVAAGGPEIHLASSPNGLQDPIGIIRVQGGRVFWAPGISAILSVAVTGGALNTVTTNIASLSDFVVDDAYVYFSEDGTGDIKRVPARGGPAETLGNGLGSSYNILAQNTSEIYSIDQLYVHRWPKNGGQGAFVNPNPLAAEPGFPASIAVDASRVYWTHPPVQLIQYVPR